MPFSNWRGKDASVSWIQQKTDINTVVDIGAGSGTYPILLKETNQVLNNAKWIGIEAWEPYIEEFDLNNKYDVLYNEDARFLDWGKFGNVDLTICGDVLEHMTKEEAQGLINEALKHSKYVLISIPIKHMPQGAEHGNPFEIHVKDNWTHEEELESFPNIKQSKPVKKIGVYWLER